MVSVTAQHQPLCQAVPNTRIEMQLSQLLVERFRVLHREKYGTEISYEAAELQLKEIAELVRITASKQEVKQSA